jgi:hypothetical protein
VVKNGLFRRGRTTITGVKEFVGKPCAILERKWRRGRQTGLVIAAADFFVKQGRAGGRQ